MHSISSIRFLLCGLIIGLMLISCSQSFAQVGVGIYVNFAPPDLPVYDQPECPSPDYIWTPGYWAWSGDIGYFWVPGTWVLAPEPGYYWTPGYWAWGGNGFFFTPGYWGPVVGFYGGINYGYGYFGHGYEGGRWDNGQFYYNRSVNNVNVTNIRNVYNTTVVNNTVTRVSYNGGDGGVSARPTAQEQAATRERHISAIAAQTQQMEVARSNPEMRAAANNGRPPVAATAKPGAFRGSGVVAARQAGAVHGPESGTRQTQTRPGAPQTPQPQAVPRPERQPAERPLPQQQRPEQQRPEQQPPQHPVPQQQPRQEPQPPQRPPIPEPPNHENRPNTVTHPNEIPQKQPPAPPNTGNAKLDEKYQRQQQKLESQQSKEREKLQQQQDREHQRIAQQQANEAPKQQMEQRHQQQTQQMMDRQEQQSQHMQNRQQHPQPPPPVHATSRPPEQK